MGEIRSWFRWTVVVRYKRHTPRDATGKATRMIGDTSKSRHFLACRSRVPCISKSISLCTIIRLARPVSSPQGCTSVSRCVSATRPTTTKGERRQGQGRRFVLLRCLERQRQRRSGQRLALVLPTDLIVAKACRRVGVGPLRSISYRCERVERPP